MNSYLRQRDLAVSETDLAGALTDGLVLINLLEARARKR
jgi:hypothetical protein